MSVLSIISCRSLIAAGLLAGTVALGVGNARAEGFLGGIINQVAPGVGTALDQANAALGNPVDHAFAAGANTLVPGSGAALEGAWALQRSGVLNQLPFHGPAPAVPGPLPGQFTGPVPGQFGGPIVGNFCATPVGVFPGPWNPVGMPCNAVTPFGMAFGQVIRG